MTKIFFLVYLVNKEEPLNIKTGKERRKRYPVNTNWEIGKVAILFPDEEELEQEKLWRRKRVCFPRILNNI